MLGNTSLLLYAACVSLLVSPSLATFNITSKENVVVYYGQGSGQKRLAAHCRDPRVDVIILSFVHLFPQQANGYPGINFGNQCYDEAYPGPGYNGINDPSKNQLLKCPNLQIDLNYCRRKRPSLKFLLSLGGGTNEYQLTGVVDGIKLATQLWYVFGPRRQNLVNRGLPRPFDYKNIGFSVDGFDFDIEHPSLDNSAGYNALATELKRLYSTERSSQYYLTASPQCLVPDPNLKGVLSTTAFDMLFIQFYNTYMCSARRWAINNPLYQVGGPFTPAGFTYDDWTTYLAYTPSKNARLFIGLPGSAEAASPDSAITVKQAKSLVNAYYCRPNFGGVSIWEATSAAANIYGPRNFYQNIKIILRVATASASRCVARQ